MEQRNALIFLSKLRARPVWVPRCLKSFEVLASKVCGLCSWNAYGSWLRDARSFLNCLTGMKKRRNSRRVLVAPQVFVKPFCSYLVFSYSGRQGTQPSHWPWWHYRAQTTCWTSNNFTQDLQLQNQDRGLRMNSSSTFNSAWNLSSKLIIDHLQLKTHLTIYEQHVLHSARWSFKGHKLGSGGAGQQPGRQYCSPKVTTWG